MSDSRKATPLRSYAAEGSCYAARAAAAERIGSGSILLARPLQEHTGADTDHPRTPDAGIHESRCRPPPRSRRRNTREPVQTTPRTPDAEIHGSLFRPSRAAQLSYSHRCRAGHCVQAQPAGPLGAGLACLPSAVNRRQLCIPKRNSASFSIRRIAAGVSRDPSAARRPSARASRRGSSIA